MKWKTYDLLNHQTFPIKPPSQILNNEDDFKHMKSYLFQKVMGDVRKT